MIRDAIRESAQTGGIVIASHAASMVLRGTTTTRSASSSPRRLRRAPNASQARGTSTRDRPRRSWSRKTPREPTT